MIQVFLSEESAKLKAGRYVLSTGWRGHLLWPPESQFYEEINEYDLIVFEDFYQTHGNGD